MPPFPQVAQLDMDRKSDLLVFEKLGKRPYVADKAGVKGRLGR